MRFAIALAILVIAISGFRSRLSGRLQNPKTLTRTFSSTQKYNTRTTPSPTSPTFISPLPIETLPESFIRERTFSCLDFDVILNVLTNNTLTIRGKDIAKERVGQTSDEITKDYAMVEQILGQITFLPLRSSMNVWPVLRSLEQNLSPPEKDDLAQFGRYIEEIVELKDFMIFFKDQLSLFDAVTTNMTLPMEFSSMFVNSFDDDDELNAEKYPTIKKLRQQRETLRSKIIQTIQTILKSIDMQDKLAAER